MHELTPVALTSSLFEPFGDVISKEAATVVYPINAGRAKRYHALVRPVAGPHGLSVNIFEAQPVELPLRVDLMERHPLSSQSFMPLDGRPYLVLVGQGESCRSQDIQAFWARGDQGVCYRPGIWHYPLAAVAMSQDFLVVDGGGEKDDLEVMAIDEPLWVRRPDFM